MCELPFVFSSLLRRDNVFFIPGLESCGSPTSSWTSELARTTPIWEATKGQSLAMDTATWLADWAKLRLRPTATCFRWPSWAAGAFILGSVLLTVIWRAMMGHRSARESRAVPVRRSAVLGADFRKGQWCRKAAMTLKLFLLWVSEEI